MTDLLGPEDDRAVGTGDWRLLLRLLRYLRPYHRSVALALAAIIGNAGLQLAQPYLMKVAIDQHIATGVLAGLDRIAVLFLAILLGSPQKIVDTLKRVEKSGIDEVILYFNVGNKPHNLVKEQMQRFMKEIAPQFQGKHIERMKNVGRAAHPAAA